MRRLARVEGAEQLLQVHGGGYLFNTFYEASVTCPDCHVPISAGYGTCYACNVLNGYGVRRADHRGFLVYAVGGRQSETLMYGYKSAHASERNKNLVKALLTVGVFGHSPCLRALTGSAELRWAAVPSLKGRPGIHPIAEIMRSMVIGGLEVELDAKQGVTNARALDPEHFAVRGPLPADCTALVIDDTWVGGGHAESAGAALRAAGAEHIAILNVARMLNMSWSPNPPFVASKLVEPYSAEMCPWTATGVCPE